MTPLRSLDPHAVYLAPPAPWRRGGTWTVGEPRPAKDENADGEQPPADGGRRPVLPEKLLAKLWMARAGRRMRTTDGRRLRVLYPGRPAPGHGPDFQDAVIELDGRRVRGPVELHRTPADWAAHGHSEDPAYDEVVLHVVSAAGDGRGAPDMPTVEMDTHPDEAEFPHGGPLLARLGALDDGALKAALRRAGLARFRERADQAADVVAGHGVEQAMYLGVMEALGYSENRAPFRELARRVPVAVLRAAALAFPPERRVALLRDLLASASGLEAPSEAWLRLGGTAPMEQTTWGLAGVRPSNHPLRRMGSAAALLGVALPLGLTAYLRAACVQGPKALVGALRVPPPAAFGWPSASALAAGVGEQRARETAVNAVLPVLLAWARAKRDRGLARACMDCYGEFPALGENTVTREARRLLGERGERLRLAACEHQGLMRLYRNAVKGKE